MKWDILKQGRYYKVGQVLQSGTTFVSKWETITKIVHYRWQMREIGEGNRFLQLTPIFTLDLLSNRHFIPRNS